MLIQCISSQDTNPGQEKKRNKHHAAETTLPSHRRFCEGNIKWNRRSNEHTKGKEKKEKKKGTINQQNP
jgi:uncharacterized protein YdaU (DUF1376 family)